MDLNQLAVLVRVIDAGSFTRAAKLLKQPKSRVSRRIAALERELGVSLLYRTTRQFRPTEAGQAIYEQCRGPIYALDHATSSAKDHSKVIAGILRVTAPEDLGSELLCSVVHELTSKHAGLTIDTYFTNKRLDLVKDGIDVAIRVGELKDATLMAKKIGSVASVLVASPEYLRKSDKLNKITALSSHAALHFTAPSEENVWVVTAGGKRGEQIRINPICRSTNPKILVELAVKGSGIAFVPEFLCLDLLKAGKLKRVFPDYQGKTAPLHFVWPSQNVLSPKVRVFIDAGLKHLSRYFCTT